MFLTGSVNTLGSSLSYIYRKQHVPNNCRWEEDSADETTLPRYSAGGVSGKGERKQHARSRSKPEAGRERGYVFFCLHFLRGFEHGGCTFLCSSSAFIGVGCGVILCYFFCSTYEIAENRFFF